MTSLRQLLAALAMVFLATPLPSQTITFADPVVSNSQGQPMRATDVFLHSRDGSIIGIAPNIATSQTSVSTSPTLVCPARPGRQRAILTEITAVDFYYGGPGVSALSGAFVKGVAGATVTLDTPAAIYVAGMAAVTMTCAELY